jgi:O-antigen/teichoic acid export membrane protein
MLGPDGRGVFAAAQIWPMIIAGLAFFGANHALTLRAATYQGERGGLYGAALALGSVLSVVALAAGAIAIPLLLENRDVQAAALLFLWQIPIFILTSLLVSVDVGLGRFGPYNVGRWILASTYFGIVLALAVFGVRSPQAYLNGLLAANAASLVFLLANVPWRSLTVRSPHVKALIEGGRFQAATVALLARDQIERLFVLYALSLEDLGQYVVAYSAAMMPAVLAKSLGLIVFSRSAIAGKTGAYEDTGRLFRQLFALNVAITAGSAVVLPCLIPLFYGDGFAPAGRIALSLLSASSTRGCADRTGHTSAPSLMS